MSVVEISEEVNIAKINIEDLPEDWTYIEDFEFDLRIKVPKMKGLFSKIKSTIQ